MAENFEYGLKRNNIFVTSVKFLMLINVQYPL